MNGFQQFASRLHDPLARLVAPRRGQRLTRGMLMDLIRDHPEFRYPDWLYATDHCRNRTNKGACRCALTDEALFEWIGRGHYRVR